MLSKKRERISAEQKKVEKIRVNIQNTLNDLRTKQVIDGSKEIVDSINAINDSMSGLGGNSEDPTVEDLMMPEKAVVREKTFQEIMRD